MSRTIRWMIVSLLTIALTIPSCTYTHTIYADCTVPSLISAVNSANTDPSLTRIYLSPGCVYTLTAAAITVEDTFDGTTFEYGSVGLPPIDSLVELYGRDATITRGAAAPHFRILHITKKGNLTVSAVTISNGFADSSMPGGSSSYFPGSGGGIYNDGVLTVDGCTLEKNHADFSGGAIFTISAADTNVKNSSITDNTASLGGGIFVYGLGVLSIDKTHILRNDAASEGGGINVAYGSGLSIQRSVISFNHSGRRGGAIFKDSGSKSEATSISSTTFEGNNAEWGGGAVFIWRTPLSIGSSTFLENKANEYGGGLVYQSSGTETVTIRSSSFEGNQAGMDGGGLHFSGQRLEILKTTFTNNRARNGGAIHQAEITDATYISRANSATTVSSCIFDQNKTKVDGGGIFNGGSLAIDGSEFTGNVANGNGGGISNLWAIVVLDSTFTKNAARLSGGGISTSGSAAIARSTFSANTALSGGWIGHPERSDRPAE